MGGQNPLVLVLTNAQDATADYLQDRLAAAGVCYKRLNTELLRDYAVSYRLSDGRILGKLAIDETLEIGRIRSIYYRRPALPTVTHADLGVARWIQNEIQSAWGGILQSLVYAKWVNHPLAISGANYKPEQIARAARLGLRVPDTLVTSFPDEAELFCRERGFDVIVKPIGHGEIRGGKPSKDRLVYTNLLSERDTVNLRAVATCPTMFQARVAKACDLRVTIVEDRCFVVTLHSQERDGSRIDCRRDNMSEMRYTAADIPKELEAKLVELTRSYGLSFSAIDLAADTEGRYWFFELNPAGQWAWLEQRTGVPISEALVHSLAV